MALTDGLIEYWKLDGNSNGVFGNNGTDTNITYSAANGKLIQGAGFNGSSSNSTISSFNLSSTNVLSISFWLKFTSTSALVLMEHSNNYNSNNAFIVNINNGRVEVGQHTATGYNVGTTSSTLNDGNWHHIVVVFNRNLTFGAQTTAYLDGVSNYTQVLTTTLSGNFSTFNMYIGSRANSSLWYNSALDEIGFWNRALSSNEVKDLYLNGNGSQYPFRDKGFLMM